MLNGALNEDLQRLDVWLRGNKLSMNVVKTKSLLIASNQKHKHFRESGEKLALKIRGRDIEATPHIKYLGVYIDDTLNWKKQIQLISNKISRALRVLNYSKPLFQSKTLKTLYTSIIEPHLRYCRSVIINTNVYTGMALQKNIFLLSTCYLSNIYVC